MLFRLTVRLESPTVCVCEPTSTHTPRWTPVGEPVPTRLFPSMATRETRLACTCAAFVPDVNDTPATSNDVTVLSRTSMIWKVPPYTLPGLKGSPDENEIP